MMIHPYLSSELARQHGAELTTAAEARRLSRAARRGSRRKVESEPATIQLPDQRSGEPDLRLEAVETVDEGLCLLGGMT